jgi:putative flippase GtrA
MIGPRHYQLMRFGIVGALVAGLYVGTYLLVLEMGVVRQLANLLAFLLAVTVQYLGQTWFTFRQPLGRPDQIFRFACTIGLGFAVSALITGVLGPGLGWQDWISAAVVTVWLPVQNYLVFRVWVYADTSQ